MHAPGLPGHASASPGASQAIAGASLGAAAKSTPPSASAMCRSVRTTSARPVANATRAHGISSKSSLLPRPLFDMLHTKYLWPRQAPGAASFRSAATAAACAAAYLGQSVSTNSFVSQTNQEAGLAKEGVVRARQQRALKTRDVGFIMSLGNRGRVFCA